MHKILHESTRVAANNFLQTCMLAGRKQSITVCYLDLYNACLARHQQPMVENVKRRGNIETINASFAQIFAHVGLYAHHLYLLRTTLCQTCASYLKHGETVSLQIANVAHYWEPEGATVLHDSFWLAYFDHQFRTASLHFVQYVKQVMQFARWEAQPFIWRYQIVLPIVSMLCALSRIHDVMSRSGVIEIVFDEILPKLRTFAMESDTKVVGQVSQHVLATLEIQSHLCLHANKIFVSKMLRAYE